MRMTGTVFRHWEKKALTLMGMSGVGKTTLAHLLRLDDWFHYSVDFRIGTRYLNEPILDNIKLQMMQIPFLRDLLRTDSVFVANNLQIDNLKPVATFLGMIGNPLNGGLSLAEFQRRQALHRAAETAALLDVPDFIRKSDQVYGYRNLVNDTGGSLCELDDLSVLETLATHTVLIYIEASAQDEEELVRRAQADPKPLYYRPEFLLEQLAVYLHEHGLQDPTFIDPNDFVRWIFPKLFHARIPRYAQIAEQFGYTITTAEARGVKSHMDLLQLIETALNRQS